MTFNDALIHLCHAIGGDAAAFVAALVEARTALGVPDKEIPEYLPRALAAMAGGSTKPEGIPSDQRGFAWLLHHVTPLFPGAVLIDEFDRDGLAIPALGRALVIERGDERWTIVDWPPAPSQAPLRVMNTFNPTLDQVRAWARDPNLRLTEQDEALVLIHPSYLEELIALAAEPAGPKRDYILSILDRIVELPGPDRLASVVRARDLARKSGAPALAMWADQLDRLLAYAHGHGPVTLDQARTIAHDLMIGRRRPGLTLDESSMDGWWLFQARGPGGTIYDALHVHGATGIVVWSRAPLTIEALAPYKQAQSRLAPLGS